MNTNNKTSQTKYLNNFLNEVGHSVHCMNTIAVSLSSLNKDTKKPEKLNISWNPDNVEQSSINSRRFAVKSSIVYSIETLYTYLTIISKNPIWLSTNKSFTDKKTSKKKELSKAECVIRLLKDIKTIETEWIVLVELLCHWRNRVVHATTSNAKVSNKSRQLIQSKEKEFYENYHHFSIKLALENFNNNTFTLKDVTTLITILIKCVKEVDHQYINYLKSLESEEIIKMIIDEKFDQIKKLVKSDKKYRKLSKWLSLNFYFLGDTLINEITKKLN